MKPYLPIALLCLSTPACADTITATVTNSSWYSVIDFGIGNAVYDSISGQPDEQGTSDIEPGDTITVQVDAIVPTPEIRQGYQPWSYEWSYSVSGLGQTYADSGQCTITWPGIDTGNCRSGGTFTFTDPLPLPAPTLGTGPLAFAIFLLFLKRSRKCAS